jgi:hypothetical protein
MKTPPGMGGVGRRLMEVVEGPVEILTGSAFDQRKLASAGKGAQFRAGT